MRIAVDAMGGDHAPDAIVRGCADALPDLPPGDQLVLVGRRRDIEELLNDEPRRQRRTQKENDALISRRGSCGRNGGWRRVG